MHGMSSSAARSASRTASIDREPLDAGHRGDRDARARCRRRRTAARSGRRRSARSRAPCAAPSRPCGCAACARRDRAAARVTPAPRPRPAANRTVFSSGRPYLIAMAVLRDGSLLTVPGSAGTSGVQVTLPRVPWRSRPPGSRVAVDRRHRQHLAVASVAQRRSPCRRCRPRCRSRPISRRGRHN